VTSRLSAQRERRRLPATFKTCGGCHIVHSNIRSAEQLRLKKEILLEELSRLGGIQWAGADYQLRAEPIGVFEIALSGGTRWHTPHARASRIFISLHGGAR